LPIKIIIDNALLISLVLTSKASTELAMISVPWRYLYDNTRAEDLVNKAFLLNNIENDKTDFYYRNGSYHNFIVGMVYHTYNGNFYTIAQLKRGHDPFSDGEYTTLFIKLLEDNI